MERLLALALLALALAGCTAPASTSEQAAETVEVAGPGEGQGAAPDAGPRIEPVITGPVPRPIAEEPPAAPPSESERASAANASNATEAPPGNRSDGASGASPEGNAKSPAEPTPANASKTSAPAPPPPAPPAVPTAALPALRVGDTWRYRGTNLSGEPYEEVRTVKALDHRAGIPTYRLESTVRGASQELHLTREGLNNVNGTGFVTELLRFPLRVGDNWTFGWSKREPVVVQGATFGTLPSSMEAVVEVVEHRTLLVPAGKMEAFHLRANLTTTVGSMSSWILLDYWYAPAAMALVKAEQRTSDGRTSWSDLLAGPPAR